MINLNKAKYYATLILQTTSLCELYLKDYETELYKQGFLVKQFTKKKVNDNARQAKSLRLQLAALEGELTASATDSQKDSMLEDVGFLHNLIVLTFDRVGDNEEKREKVINYISEIESELNI